MLQLIPSQLKLVLLDLAASLRSHRHDHFFERTEPEKR